MRPDAAQPQNSSQKRLSAGINSSSLVALNARHPQENTSKSAFRRPFQTFGRRNAVVSTMTDMLLTS
jgi:hypothetical protein